MIDNIYQYIYILISFIFWEVVQGDSVMLPPQYFLQSPEQVRYSPQSMQRFFTFKVVFRAIFFWYFYIYLCQERHINCWRKPSKRFLLNNDKLLLVFLFLFSPLLLFLSSSLVFFQGVYLYCQFSLRIKNIFIRSVFIYV